jgi:uncharacterized DUF497 family protein
MIFQWNDWNRDHITKHAVKPLEAEHVVNHARAPFPREIDDEKHMVWGQTDRGRYLQVIFVYLSDEEVDFESLSLSDRLRFEAGEDEVGFVIHAMELTPIQKRSYRRMTR